MATRTVIAVLGGGIAFAGTVLVTCACMAGSGALLEFSQPTYDGGQVRYDETVHVIVEFINRGNKPLEIHRIKPSCQCLMSQLEKRTYAPGERGAVQISFVASQDAGQAIRHTVGFESNDYKHPFQQVELTASMEPSLTVFPREVSLGALRCGHAGAAEIVVSPPAGSREFHVSSVSTDVPCGQVTFRRLSAISPVGEQSDPSPFPRETSYAVMFTLAPQKIVRDITGNIYISTTSGLSPTITVPVRGRIVSSFTLDPPRLLFDLSKGPLLPSKTLTVTNAVPFEIVLPVDHPHLQCVSASQFPTRRCTLVCTLKNVDPRSNARGVLSLGVKGPSAEETISVPYSVIGETRAPFSLRSVEDSRH